MIAAPSAPDSVSDFLRAEPERVRDWVKQRPSRLIVLCVATIVIGAGSYGAAMGSWREPLQAVYTGIKLPLAILLTTLGNGLLNGMLAPLLGLNITFRQSLIMVLFSFAVTSVLLGALSPVAWFMVWNTPPLSAATQLSSPEYGFMQLVIAGCIAIAGVVGNVRLLPLLSQWTRSPAIARRVLLAWLAGNLFLGSQICWVLRPFIWDPAGKVEFIGQQYFHGSFFQTLLQAAYRLLMA